MTEDGREAAGTTRRGGTFKAFAHPNFRLLWVGLVVSNVGTWVQTVAQGWLIHDLTGKYLDLGLLGLARAVPLLTLSLFGGTLADRLDKRRLLYWTQGLMAFFAFVQGVLAALGVVRVWHIWTLGFASAVVLAFDQPTRQALLPALVPREDLLNAIALMSVSFNGAAILGPALAGLLVPLVGYAWAFYLNALSFGAVLLAVYWLRLARRPRPAGTKPVLQEAAEGFIYIVRHPIIRTLTVMAAVVGFFAAPYNQMLPGYRLLLHIDRRALGLLTSAPGLGTLLGGFAVARFAHTRHKGRLMLGAAGLTVLALALFSLSRSYYLSVGSLVLVGATLTGYTATMQTLLQQNTDDVHRGRVMSMFTLTVLGLSPLGALPLGALSDAVGAPWAIFSATLLVGLATLLLARPIRNLL